MKLVLVVAVALVDTDGRVLLAQRPPGRSMAGLWEFPGGKIEGEETPEAALARELREELAVECSVGRELRRYEFSYPGKKPIELIFLEARQTAGTLTNLIFEQILWCDPEKMTGYDFLEGDTPFLEWFIAQNQ